MIKSWDFTKYDEALADELRAFIPAKVFDVHTHPYRVRDLNLKGNSVCTEGPAEAGSKIIRQFMDKLLGPGKYSGGLLTAYPTEDCDIDGVNDFVMEQLKYETASRGSVCITPDCHPEKVRRYLENLLITGLKPYHCFSNEKPTFNSSIAGFLPEWAWRLADEKGLAITLHMVKDRAIADPENQNEIRVMCKRYPNAKLILAHAARSFHWPNAKKGLHALRGIENLWFDMSAICESEPIKEILYEFGPKKLMWGSDFPVCAIRGRTVTFGMDFIWLQDDTVKWDMLGTSCNPVLVGLESLRALRTATEDAGLDTEDIENIFYNNATEMFGLNAGAICGSKTQDLYEYAKQKIPGGTQLLSKRPERMVPKKWPAYFSEARGCETWDFDGRHYYDMSTNGIGACILGFRDQDVTRAVIRRVNLGSMCTLNPPEEVELADALIEANPWAEQVRYTRGGGEACSMAVRIARATTNRSVIAICGYHGWNDWYLAANLGESDELKGHLLPGLDPCGVPVELRGTSVAFRYNDRNAFMDLINRYGHKLAAVIMEPCRNSNPDQGFLELIRDTAHKCGALLIFDEVTVGWRLCYGGAHKRFGVNPDLAVFAKALGNGHPIGAVIGTKAAMDGANISFISSTYWTESTGPVAALATLKKMKRIDVPGHIAVIGDMVMESWRKHSISHGLDMVSVEGFPCLAHFTFKHEQSGALRTLYTQMMLEKGFLADTGIYPTLAHTPELAELYGKAVDEVFGEISLIIDKGDIGKYLKDGIAESGFGRLL